MEHLSWATKMAEKTASPVALEAREVASTGQKSLDGVETVGPIRDKGYSGFCLFRGVASQRPSQHAEHRMSPTADGCCQPGRRPSTRRTGGEFAVIADSQAQLPLYCPLRLAPHYGRCRRSGDLPNLSPAIKYMGSAARPIYHATYTGQRVFSVHSICQSLLQCLSFKLPLPESSRQSPLASRSYGRCYNARRLSRLH